MRAKALGLGVCLMVFGGGRDAAAQTPPGRAWADVDYVVAVPKQDEQTVGTFSSTATYPELENAHGFAVGAGVQVDPLFGVMGRYERAGFQDRAGVTASALNSFNLPVGDEAATATELDRTDHLFDIGVTVRPWRGLRHDVRLFGGPTLFRVSQERVSEVVIQQIPSPPLVPEVITITAAEVRRVTATGLGVHVGGDVAFFITPTVGVGAGVRIRFKGAVDMDDPLSGEETQVEAARTSIGFGARVRF